LPQGKENLFTVDEISEIFGYSKNSLVTKFKQTSDSIQKKYGIELAKIILKEGTFYYFYENQSKNLNLYKNK